MNYSILGVTLGGLSRLIKFLPRKGRVLADSEMVMTPLTTMGIYSS